MFTHSRSGFIPDSRASSHSPLGASYRFGIARPIYEGDAQEVGFSMTRRPASRDSRRARNSTERPQRAPRRKRSRLESRAAMLAEGSVSHDDAMYPPSSATRSSTSDTARSSGAGESSAGRGGGRRRRRLMRGPYLHPPLYLDARLLLEVDGTGSEAEIIGGTGIVAEAEADSSPPGARRAHRR